jgi:hypothetical protein
MKKRSGGSYVVGKNGKPELVSRTKNQNPPRKTAENDNQKTTEKPKDKTAKSSSKNEGSK